MANLKGGTYAKQIKDASIRMNAIGQKKDGDSKGSHSLRTHENRRDMLKEFANYATSNSLDQKLNEAMTTENVNNFFNERLDGLKTVTQENYIRNFGAMVESLKDSNVGVSSSSTDFNNRVHELKSNAANEVITGRVVETPGRLINNLSYSHGVVAEIQKDLGLRVSEAVEVVNNLDRYLNDRNGTLNGIIGKGGREYIPKDITRDLVAKIELAEKVDKRAYQSELQENGVKSHDFRYTFAKEKHEAGMSKREISLELNHNREEITNYYLSRA